jgi:hypothetical protein
MMSMGDVHGSVDDLGSEPRAPDEGAAPPPAGEQPGFGAAPQHGGGPSAHNFKRYVLYVGPSSRGGQQMCPGSQAALDVIETFKEDVAIADVNKLRLEGEQLPEWLEGTPCVVNTAEKLAYMGSHCIAHLKQHTQRGQLQSELDFDGVEPDSQGFAALEWSSEPASTASGQPRVDRPAHAGPAGPGRVAPPARDQKLDESALQRMIEERLSTTASRQR